MPLCSVAQNMAATVGQGDGKAHPAEEHGRDFPDSSLWTRFSVPERRAATKFDRNRPVDNQKGETLGLVGSELVASYGAPSIGLARS